jgi:hypothetical protein
MCKSKNGLHKIKPESILFAYRYYGTIIKTDSFCCNRHIESNGEIKHEDFIKISRKKIYFRFGCNYNFRFKFNEFRKNASTAY